MKSDENRFGKTLAIKGFIDLIFSLISLLIIVITIIGSLGSILNPTTNKLSYLFSLIMPILFFINFILLIYRFGRQKFNNKLTYIHIILLLLIGKDLINLPFSGSKEIEEEKGLSIFSYNVRSFNYYNKEPLSILGVINEVNEKSPDIVCLQEYLEFNDTTKINFHKRIMTTYPYKFYDIKGHNAQASGGLILYSKYPIIDGGVLEYENSTIAIFTDIKYKTDTLRVINTHLQSTKFNQTSLNYLKSGRSLDNKNDRKYLNNIFSEIYSSAGLRVKQVELINKNVEYSEYPTIICGDFNENNFSYIYNEITKKTKDAYKEVGKGYVSTYKGLYNLFRIDHIFYTNHIQGIKYKSPSLPYSDHNPVLFNFLIK